MKVVNCILALLLSLGVLPMVLAQSGPLERYVREGLENNLPILRQQLQLQGRQLNLREARGKFLPRLSLEADYLLAAGGRTINIPVGELLNPVNRTLNQLTDSEQFPTNLSNVDEQFLPNNFHDTRLEVRQPLFNPKIYYNYRAQQQLITVEEAQMRSLKTELRKDIRVAYYQYAKTREVLRIYDSTEVLLKELLRFNEKLVRYDKATRDAVTSVQFELDQLESRRAAMEQQRDLVHTRFNTLLNRELEAPIELKKEIATPQPLGAPLASLQDQALAMRQELDRIDGAIRANQINTKLNEKNRLPTVGLQAQAGFQGFGYDFNGNQSYATLGLNLSWTLFAGQQQKIRIQQSQVETQKLRKDYEIVRQQIQLQVVDAYRAYQAAQRRLAADQSSLRNAATSFRIIRSRYKNEQALLVEYLDARTNYTNARISVSIARYDLLIRRAELEGVLNGSASGTK